MTSDRIADPRVQAIREWLQEIMDLSDAVLAPASNDASFRRYFRVQRGLESFIVMDAPPEKENTAPFVRVARHLQELQLNAPRVLAEEATQGFLLLSDLGDVQYLSLLQEQPARADELYLDAIDALVTLQFNGSKFVEKLPEYDEELLRFELSLFSDWLCRRHLDVQFTDTEQASWQTLCDVLIKNALEQPRVYVHRDYHSRNLMFSKSHNPGILDFQDAVAGPYTYDLVSLLKDCYISWPEDEIRKWAMYFYNARNGSEETSISEAEFLRHFELTGVQRELKAAGIFARLNRRDNKPEYMQDIPRTLNYILDVVPKYSELQFLGNLIRQQVLPQLSASMP